MLGFSMGAAAAEMEVFRHRIQAAFAQWLAAQQAPTGQQAAAPGAEAHDGNPCIIGASGVKATTLSQQGAQQALVETE
jgi:hypothetical protein